MGKDEAINIVIGDMTAKNSDVAVKLDKFPSIMSKAMEEVLSKAKGLSVKKSATGLKSGFKVSGNMMSLKQEVRKGQDMLICWVSVALGELPKDKLVPGKIEGMGGTSISKDLQGDAEFAVETAAKEAAKTAIKQIEKAAGS